ncbi:hypothetical protein [Paracoccus sp. (in: a-proteobacteria)]|uniref:hypothetical protein n=1 Tax=Paracoccus sp. TaxID=267 RepID=UPI00289797AF|nr:hypothetical protein [Paracoccus sp. (in: a-proteobacteria)]
MALITIPKILPVPSDIPQASFNIGRFTSVKDWWTLNREAFNGLTLRPRKGSIGLKAVGALVTEDAYGFNFPRGNGETTTPYIEGRIPAPASLKFSMVSIQRIDAIGYEPWGLSFGGNNLTSDFRIRPAPIGTGPNQTLAVYGPGQNNAYAIPNSPRAPVGVPFVYGLYLDLSAVLAGGPLVFKATINGGLTVADVSLPLTLSSPETRIAANFYLNILRASPPDAGLGPVMDLWNIDGDVFAQPELLAEINGYAAKSYGVGV